MKVSNNETEEALSQKILPLEHELIPNALELFCSKKIVIEGRNVSIKTD